MAGEPGRPGYIADSGQRDLGRAGAGVIGVEPELASPDLTSEPATLQPRAGARRKA